MKTITPVMKTITAMFFFPQHAEISYAQVLIA
jgi:hypothetical protein